MCRVVFQQTKQAVQPVDPNAETRADICEDCRFLRRREPLTCSLTRRLKGGQLAPCPQLLAAKLATPTAVCPSPEVEVARKWNAAATVPMPQAVAKRATEQAAERIAGSDKNGPAVPAPHRRGLARRPFRVY